ncbi:MAG: erythromycin esterase family protein [Candidatus Cybelea sp.]
MRTLAHLTFAFLTASVAPASGQDARPASVSIGAAYARLARAYENADEPALRALVAANFDFVFVPGTNESLSQYIADWKESKQALPGLGVSIRVVRLMVHAGTADAEILLTRSDSQSIHALVDVQREEDRWELRNGTWALVKAQTVSDTASLDGAIVSHDGPATILPMWQRDAIVAQLKELVWRIETSLPGGSQRDFAPLYNAIGSARIVAMGEGTHGTSEFFSLKNRIFRFLVERMGFTVLAMETSWNSGLAIDRFVTTGQGRARAALASAFPVWNNQEVLDLIEWMRAYNITRGNRPALRFVGIDMQDNPFFLRDTLLKFVRATRPADLDLTTQRLACLKLVAPTTAACVSGIAAVERMVANQARITTLPRDQVLQAEQAATVALEIAQVFSSPDQLEQSNARDGAMARNVQWFATTEFARSRIAIWAHDGHVMTSSTYGMIPMGTYLRRRYGASYYVIGLAFDGGSVKATGAIPSVTVSPDPPEAVGGMLRAAGEPLFGLNLRPISPQTPLGAYIWSEQPMRTLGAITSSVDLNPSQTYGYVSLKQSFDTLIFLETMHPAHALEAQAALTGSLAVPQGAGGVTWPTKWSLLSFGSVGYSAGGDAPSAAYPNGLLWLASSAAGGNAMTGGTIPVARYLGRRVQLRGDLQVSNAFGGAGAWLRVDGPNGKPISFGAMSDRMLQGTTGWSPFSIKVDVPRDARDIAFGLWLYGPGSLWATNLKLEIMAGSKS